VFCFRWQFWLAVASSRPHKSGVKHLSPLTLVACVLLCSCASTKEKPPVPPHTADAKSAKKSSDPSFFFPEGVNWNNATPTQISEAVFAAVKNNPDGAAEIAAASVREVTWTRRFPMPDDGKQSVSPESKWTLFGWLFKKKYPKPSGTSIPVPPDSQMGSGRPANTLAGAIRDWIRWPRPKPKESVEVQFEKVGRP
jgi:hypothetical protein